MCIALITTAHPKYALIIVNNRDEFILRPTSQPHWWTIKVPPSHSQGEPTTTNGHQPSHSSPSSSSSSSSSSSAAAAAASTTEQQHQNGANQVGKDREDEIQHVLSSRDLLRTEQGAWLGITRAGHFAVLTNYREMDPATGAPSVTGTKSRGAMVTAWLGASPQQSVKAFAEGMIADGTTKGVGGFTLICGKLRRQRRQQQRREEEEGQNSTTGTETTHNNNNNNNNNDNQNNLEPLAVLSNKALHSDHIPWIAGQRNETIGLSNAAFDNPVEWPKVQKGKAGLAQLLARAVDEDWSEAHLQDHLFALLSRDELPTGPDMSLEDHFKVLHESIFIPPLGNPSHQEEMARARSVSAKTGTETKVTPKSNVDTAEAPSNLNPGAATANKATSTAPAWFSTGLYGTQRQTIILVDWEGNVTYTERSLFNADGVPLEKGQGDETFRFSIEGWDQSG